MHWCIKKQVFYTCNCSFSCIIGLQINLHCKYACIKILSPSLRKKSIGEKKLYKWAHSQLRDYAEKGDLKESHNNVKIQHLRSVINHQEQKKNTHLLSDPICCPLDRRRKKLDSDVLTQKCIINPQTFLCNCRAQHQHHKSPRPPDHWGCYRMSSLPLYPIRIARGVWWESRSLSIWWSSESSTRLCFHLEWRNFTLKPSRARGDRLRNGQTGIKSYYAFNRNALRDASVAQPCGNRRPQTLH